MLIIRYYNIKFCLGVVGLKFTIDRFEGEFAIVELESNEIVSIPRKILAKEAKEGDIIRVSIEKEETESRKIQIQKKFDNLA